MSDEEILKRLAVIEGWSIRFSTSGPDRYYRADATSLDDYQDPLHNDAQCLVLIKKHCLWVDGPVADGDEWGVGNYGGPIYKDASLNHAVCFAIIQDAGVE